MLSKIYKTGDCILVSSKRWLPRAIQWFQSNKWNHVGLIINIQGTTYVCEATEKGICLTNLNKYLKNLDSYDVKHMRPNIEFTNALRTWVTRFALPKCGHKGYDFWNLLIRFPIRFIQEKLWGSKYETPKWAQDGDEKDYAKRFTCSEWVAYVYFKAFGLFPDWNLTAPSDIDKSADMTTVAILE